ncbi:MAG: PKD domain-containing protein [Alphaproteobacteria bacterium]|nr:PKD domain-containing protein [Alphaproteobacteria bacterium]
MTRSLFYTPSMVHRISGDRKRLSGWVALSGMVLGLAAMSVFGPFAAGSDARAQSDPVKVDASPLLVTFGPLAPISEGDHDRKQYIRFSVPQDAGKLHIRVFDPDIGGKNDEYLIGWGTQTRFDLYGDKAEAELFRDAEGAIQESIAGEPLDSVTFGEDSTTDDQWKTLFTIDAEKGAANGQRRAFVLAVEGAEGTDGNVFDVAVSTSDQENEAPSDLRLYSYVPTFQVAERGMLTELRFNIPEMARSLTIENFDAAGGRVAYDGLFRSYPLAASGKSEWRRATVYTNDSERGRLGSVIVAEGGETPNDVTVHVTYSNSNGEGVQNPIAIDLPVRTFRPNGRPVVETRIQQTACREMRFDASASRDPDGETLTHLWRFDDSEQSGPIISRRFDAAGDYSVRLETFDNSGMVASGQVVDFSFYVKPPPIARLEAPVLAAEGAVVQFDATGSSTLPRPVGNRIKRYVWQMGDGTEIEQEEGDPDFGRPVHTYRQHGTYTVGLTVFDDEGNPCNSADASHTITINAAPVADAGDDQRIAYGTFATFDAGAVTGVDGDAHRFEWDFGDGKTATGAKVEHQYDEAGTYGVTLVVDDQKSATNSVVSDTATVFVNAAPIARDVAIPETLLLGAAGVFDASNVIDSDGQVTSVEWQFSDGVTLDKQAFRRSFQTPGAYEVSLLITDDSGLPNAVTTVTRTINVIDPDNQPPVPDIGAVQQALVGAPVVFDGSATTDPDGSILSYRWDFGDGTGANRVVTNHVYHRPGTYTVRLEVTDNSGKANAVASTEMDIVIAHAENVSPRVSVGSDRAAFVDERLEFDATGTVDVDGNLLSIEWDFGDGARASGFKVPHSYREPGVYQVNVLVSDDSGRRGSMATASFAVTVTHGPNSAPEVELAERLALKTEVPHRFDASDARDPDGHIIRYEWDFGDGTESDRAVVDHVYSRPGTYEGRLTLTDDSGLENGVTIHDFVAVVALRPNVPPVAEAGADQTAIVGQVVEFDGGASSDEDGSLVDFHWDFGNGKTAVGEKRPIVYFSPGRYDVKLTVTDNSGQDNNQASDGLTVVVTDRPNATPVARVDEDRPAAIDEPVTFVAGQSDDTDGNIISYLWDFGDGAKASGREVVHQYSRSGTYVAQLTVQDDSGLANNRATSKRVITVNEPPVAEAGPDQLVTASQVFFDATGSSDSDGIIISYLWDFGNGETGTGPRIAHAYRNPGTYTVKLRVIDGSGTIRNEANDELTVVVNELPVADAGFDVVTAPGELVTFDGRRSSDQDGSISRYIWDFRDGSTGEGDVVTHAFETPGLYMVELQVFDDTGHVEAHDFSQIQVTVNEQPIADAGPDLLVAPGEPFRLSGGRSWDADGEITQWRWDIQNTDTVLEGESIEHSLSEPGIYTISLTVTDDSIASNRTAQDQLTIRVNHPPVAAAGSDLVSGSLRVIFDGSASADPDNDGLSYLWDLGDGNKAEGMIVEHTYATGGIYPVRLTTDDGTGVSNARHADALKVSINRPPQAVAGDSKQACVGDVFVFDGSSSIDPDGGLLRYQWDFGDGETSDIINPTKIYGAPGNYRVRLDVTDESGLANASHADEVLASVLPAPVAHAGDDIEICAGTTIRFDGTASSDVDGVVNRYSWDFGDGQTGGGDQPEHSYAEEGIYRVTLQIEGDNLGICSPVSTDDLTVTVLDAPVAVITANAAAAVGEELEFDSRQSTSKSATISGFEWEFGDGMQATGDVVRHAYDKPGVYEVRLKARATEGAGGCESVDVVHLITVNAPPLAEIESASSVEVDRPLSLSAAGSSDSDGGITAYRWDFGDGTQATGVSVNHVWREPGQYDVVLTVDDGTGLSNSTSTRTKTIEVTPAPSAEIVAPAVACAGHATRFDLSNLPDSVDPATPRWTFGDGTTLDGKAVSHTYARPGTYSVSVSAPVDRAGNTLVTPFAREIIINRPPIAIMKVARKTCAGTTLSFDASRSFDPDGTLKKYQWDFGDGQTGEGMEVAHSYAEPGTYHPKLTVTDMSGSACEATSDSVDVFVNAPPRPDAGPDIEVLYGGAHDALLLDASRSSDPDGDPLTYYWSLSNGAEIDGERGRVEFTDEGTVTAILTAADPHGLECSVMEDTLTITTELREASTPVTD